MKEESKQYLLDEPIVTKNVLLHLLALLSVAALAGAIAGAGEISALAVGIALVLVLLVAAVFALEQLLIFRRMRLRMDETRVWTHIPLTRERSLAWKQIRTAAIVRLENMNYPAMIVLSIHEPQAVLTRKRMVWKGAKRGQEMRFPVNDARRAVVEERLKMTLPEICL